MRFSLLCARLLLEIEYFQVRENIEESGMNFNGVPMAEILICAGFFLIYLIEEMVHFLLGSEIHPHEDETIQVHQSFRQEILKCKISDFLNM